MDPKNISNPVTVGSLLLIGILIRNHTVIIWYFDSIEVKKYFLNDINYNRIKLINNRTLATVPWELNSKFLNNID